MTPYFLVLLLIIVCALFDSKSKSNGFKIFVFIVLILFAGLRYGVGRDYFSYVQIFNADKGEFAREPGRALLIEAIRYIKGTAQLYILVMAAITEFFAYRVLIKYERRDFWFLTIVFFCISLFYIASFNASREYMAIAMMLWSLQYVGKCMWKFMIIALIAGFGCHYSALLFIPLYFFIVKPHKKWVLFVILICVILLNPLIFKLLYLTPYARYELAVLNSTNDNQVQATQWLLLFISFFLVFFGDMFKNFKRDTTLFNMNALCLYTLVLVVIQDTPAFIMLFQRFNNYFVYSYLLIIPSVISSFKKDNIIISKLVVIVFSICYLVFILMVKGEHHMIVPYDIELQLFNLK